MVMRCLLVSSSEDHVDVIKQAAVSEGWQAIRHRLVDQALRAAVCMPFQLAFVDTQSVAADPLKEAYERLAMDLGQSHVPLIVISGDAGDPLGEIRARQLGVWLYLPGFDGETELDVVFREARAAHEKLRASMEAGTKKQESQVEESLLRPTLSKGLV